LRPGVPAETAFLFIHTRCLRAAMTPGARGALKEFPVD
jgi:hypothetical protein